MRRETKIGLLALVTLAVIIVGYQFLKGQEVFSKENTFYIVYENVDQLGVGDMVVINGYRVGQVTDIQLNRENVRSLIVAISLSNDLPIPKDASALIKSDGLLGGRFISLEFEKACTGADCAVTGDYLNPAEESMIAGLIGDPASLTPYIDLVRTNAGPIMDSLTSRTDTNGIGRTMRSLEATSKNLESLTGKLDRLLARTSNNLTETTGNVASITQNLEDNNAKIASILSNVDSTTAGLAALDLEKTLSTVNTTLKDLQSTIATSNGAMENISSITKSINEGEGTLGKLIGEDDIYTRLDRTVTNVDLLIQDLRLNPKRYVNVSVFGKKDKEYVVPEADPAEPQLPNDN
ncbi:MAG: MlaD family protein [Saprospiraceae bacterium]